MIKELVSATSFKSFLITVATIPGNNLMEAS